MQLEQQFTIPTDISTAWDLLIDVEQIAPCFPGAKILSVEGDSVEGQVKVKLGPIMLTYAGVLKFLERDAAQHRLVMDGQGVDAKGNGSASARVTAQLAENADGTTLCTLVTDLNITGRPAQFGRGMMLEIGNNILRKFSTNLANMLAADVISPSDSPSSAQVPAQPVPAAQGEDQDASKDARPGVHRRPGAGAPAAPREEEPLDLLRAASGATLKRVVPALAALAVVAAVIVWIAVK